MKRIAFIAAGTVAVAASLSLATAGGGVLAASAAPAAGSSAALRLAASAAPLPTIRVRMTGKTISVSGALESGGVRVVSKVTGEPAGVPTFVRLDPGTTVGQLLQAAAGDPNNIALIASIVFSPQANKGTTVAQAHLTPGRYVAVDLASEAKVPPLTTFTVAAAASPARLPKAAATISAIEFGFRGPGRLHDGELVRFANHGFLVHMIVAARAHSESGAREIARLLKAGKDGQAQSLATSFYSFVNIMTHGRYQQQVIHNRPGYWVLVCFMPTQDGREHTQLGMERVIRIVK